LLTTFTNPSPTGEAAFGYAVAGVGSDGVVICAPNDDTGATDTGLVYLFTAGGALLTTFTNPAPSDYDRFGSALAGMGNDRVLIGDNGDDTGAVNAGVAYLFNTNGALLTTFINPTPADFDGFGFALTPVGTDRVLIGTEGFGAYLFTTDGTLLTTFTNPAPAGFGSFGLAVAGVGTDKVLVGAPADDTGAANAGVAHMFSTNGTLLMTFTNPAPADYDYFGGAVAAVGTDRVLIGTDRDDTGATDAGVVYLFSTNGTLLATLANPSPAGYDRFGYSVASVGTDRLVIGAYYDDTGAIDTGAAYLFSLESFTPGLVAEGVPPQTITTESLADGAVTAPKIGGVLYPSQVPDLDASKITSGTLSNNLLPDTVARTNQVWLLAGNAGTTAGLHFLGTTDDQPLELKVNGQRALRLEPGGSNSVNVIGGWNRNEISTGLVGATIAGGGGGDYIHGASFTNRVEANFGFIGGGAGNRIDPNAVSATLAGGWENTIEADASVATLLGGWRNTIEPDASYSTLGGGVENTIGSIAYYATLAGGERNLIYSNADYAIIPGGHLNTATNYAFAAGNRAKARHTGAFVWADSTDEDFPSTANNQFLIRAAGGVGINTTNPAATLDVAGTVRAATIELTSTTTISNFNADLLDGRDSSAFWGVGGNSNTIAGTHFLGTTDDQPLELKVDGRTALRLVPTGSNSVNVVAGWGGNFVKAGVVGATIAGGGAGDILGYASSNSVSSSFSSIGGGQHNTIEADAGNSVIGGGYLNSIRTNSGLAVIGGGDANSIRGAHSATIGGGRTHRILDNADSATIGGGNWNTIESDAAAATISGGHQNHIQTNAFFSTIAGGFQNLILADGWAGTVAGGLRNEAATEAFAAGNRAKARHTGAFVWADSTEADFASSDSNQFLVRATGGVGINTTNPTATLDVAGTVRAATIELTTSTTISNFNADLLDGLEGWAFWSITGNTGTLAGTHFLGTADNQPLELKANRQRVLRLEPDTNGAPNVIGGAPLNVVDPGIMGATIGGGGATNSFSPYLPGGQLPGINRVSAHFGTVAGGGENTIERDAIGAAVGGGLYNQTASNAVVAAISGGALNVIGTNANGGTIGGGYQNSIGMNAYQAAIGGGSNNTVQAWAAGSTIGGGALNSIRTSAGLSTIAGGYSNQIDQAAFSSVIGGGERNLIQHDAVQSTIAGGAANTVWNNTFYAAIPGGYNNEVAASYGFAAGRRAKAYHAGSFVWADSQNSDFASTANNQFSVRADGGLSLVGGSSGLNGAACRIESTAGNGVGLWVTQTSSDSTAVLANTGIGDLLKAFNPGLVFRLDNAGNVSATSFTGSGAGLTGLNASQLTSGTVPGGRLSGTYSGAMNLSNPANSFSGNGSGLTGLNASQLTSGTVNDARLSANVARLNSSPTFTGTVTAGIDLRGNGRLVVGASQSATGSYASIVGGSNNSNHGSRSSIGGGQANGIAADADYTAISGGQDNTASADWISIGGGQNNNASGSWAAVGGGFDCQANNAAATVGGGYNNTASGNSATIPGGADNAASGNYSFAAGRYAQATHTASVVFSGGETTASWGDRTFTARAHGGARFYSASGTATGVELAAGGNSWSAVSDRNVKENFAQVDARAVLEKVAALPMTTWNLKSQPKEIRHIGPMAQDFHAAFKVGEDDRHISSSDADGVALAAIQGLNQKLTEELERRDAENAELRHELRELRQLVTSLASSQSRGGQ